MPKTYKTPLKLRLYGLRYYRQHRDAILIRMCADRRARGMKPRGGWNRLTPDERLARQQERLARIIMCRRCERQITTPSILLKGETTCCRCLKANRRARERAKGSPGKSQRAYRQSATSKYGKFKAWKKTLRCVHCGSAKSLDFHHRDPAMKSFRVSRGVYHVSKERLEAEIAKCDVLCRACHTAHHHPDSVFEE